MARGLTIGPIGSPYTLTANPVGFNYLMYSRALQQTGPGEVFTLGAGALSFGYTLQNTGLNPPINLALLPLSYAYTLQASTLTYVTVPPPAVTGGYYKFNPGRVVSSEMDENTPAFSQVQSEINTWAANPTGFLGYRYTLCWRDLEDFTQAKNLNNPAAIATQYPGVLLHQAAFYYLMAKSAGTGQYQIYVNFDIISPGTYTNSVITGTNWLTSGSKSVPRWVINCTGISGTSTPGTLTVPDFYGASTTSIYSGSVAPMYSGSPYYGIAFAAYGSSAFSRLVPKFWEPPVNQARKQALQALAQFTFTAGSAWSSATAYTVGTPVTSGGQNWLCKVANTNSLPASGNTNWMANTWVGETINSCPNIERWGTNDEYAYTMISGSSNNIAGCAYQNPPFSNGISAIAPTSANALIGLTNLSQAWAVSTPNTIVDTCLSFGFDGTGTFDSNTNMPGYWNNLISGSGLSAIPGLALGNSNWFAIDFASAANAALANAFQQGHIGISPAAGGTGSTFTLPTPTFISLVPLAPLTIQHQPEDYWEHLPSGTTGSSAAAVTALLAPSAKVLATHEVWNITTSQSGSAYQYSPTFYTAIIQPTLASVSLSSVLMQQNLMLAAQSLAVVATGTTTATVTWAGDTNAANTSHGWVIKVNGSTVGTLTTASAASFALTGLTAGSTYSVTVAMTNANGTGPMGTTPYTAPIFFFPNFSSVAGLTFSNAAHQSGSTISLLSTAGHDHGSVWWSTKLAPGPFTCNFQFSITGLPSGGGPAGMTFCIQNIPAGTSFVGDANGLGFSGATNQGTYGQQAAIKFDFSLPQFDKTFPSAGSPSSTGLYLNGGTQCQPSGNIGAVPWTDLNPLGLNFFLGHTFAVNLVYDGTLLTMVMTDTTTNASGRFSWPLNLANSTNSVSNFVGFTAGGALGTQAVYSVFNLNYTASAGTRLATPTFSPTPGQYAGTQTVTISGPAGSSIYYTLNGWPPTTGSLLYTGPITISSNEVIQAVAVQTGFTDSLIGVGSYQIGTANAINFPSGFAAGGLDVVGYGYKSGSTYVLSDTVFGNSATACYFPVPVTISGIWTTTFQLQMTSAANGFAGFLLQNSGTAQAATSLTGVSITGTSGQISFSSNSAIVLGSTITVSGATGIASGAYMLGACTATTATLQNSGGGAITTTIGTPGGTWQLNVPSWPGGLGAIGWGGTQLGFSGIDSAAGTANKAAGGLLNSVCVYINQQANTVAVLTDGVDPVSAGGGIATGLNLSGTTGNWNVTVSYTGTTLTVALQASTGGTTFTHNYTVNIPSTVGANTAYVAILGAGNDSAGKLSALNNWTGMNP